MVRSEFGSVFQSHLKVLKHPRFVARTRLDVEELSTRWPNDIFIY